MGQLTYKIKIFYRFFVQKTYIFIFVNSLLQKTQRPSKFSLNNFSELSAKYHA